MNNLVRRQQGRLATCFLHTWKRKLQRVVTAQPEMRPEATSRMLRVLQDRMQVYHRGIENALRDLDRREKVITKSIRRERNKRVATGVHLYGGSPPIGVYNLLYNKLREIRLEKKTMQNLSSQLSAEAMRLNVDVAFVRSVARQKRENRSTMEEKEAPARMTRDILEAKQTSQAEVTETNGADGVPKTITLDARQPMFADGSAAKGTPISKPSSGDTAEINKQRRVEEVFIASRRANRAKKIPEDCQLKLKDRCSTEPLRQALQTKTTSVTRRVEEIITSRKLARTKPNEYKVSPVLPTSMKPKRKDRITTKGTQLRTTSEVDSQLKRRIDVIIAARQASRVDSRQRRLSELISKRISDELRGKRLKQNPALWERVSYALAYACGVALLGVGLATLWLPTNLLGSSSKHQLHAHPEQTSYLSPLSFHKQIPSGTEYVSFQKTMHRCFSSLLAVWTALSAGWDVVKRMILGRTDVSDGRDVPHRHLAYGRGLDCVMCRECDSFPNPSGETVFIAHTKQDEAGAHHAAELWDTLTRMKYSVFYDVRSVLGGDLWRQLIEEKVASSHVFVCLVSDSFWFRPWCMIELDIAMRHKKIIIPVSVQRNAPDIDEEFCAKFRQVHCDEDPEQDPEQVERWLHNIKNLKKMVNWIHISSDQDRDIRLKWATSCAVRHHIHGQSPGRA